MSLQSIGDRTVSLFSRSFNFLHPSLSSAPVDPSPVPPDDLPLPHGIHRAYTTDSHSGVYRNQSRRKYQTSSLRNPYRRSSTNFPVHGHETLFLPEFSIKGKITEADFEVNSSQTNHVHSRTIADFVLGHQYYCAWRVRQRHTSVFAGWQADLRHEDHEQIADRQRQRCPTSER